MRIWAMIRKHNKMKGQSLRELERTGSAWDVDSLHEALGGVCDELDLSRPVVLKKHANELNRFSRTVFTRRDFIEKVDFDKLEVEIIDEKKPKGQELDPLYV